MAWMTRLVLNLDASQTRAAAAAQLEENVRLALWRMDSALALLMAEESARPYFTYRPLYPAERAFTNMFAEIEKGIAAFAVKAREGTISIPDLQGGTFTITNGGVFGSLLSTPILNPPQSGILGMHSIQKRPVAVGDDVVSVGGHVATAIVPYLTSLLSGAVGRGC